MKYLYPAGYQSMHPQSGPWRLSVLVCLWPSRSLTCLLSVTVTIAVSGSTKSMELLTTSDVIIERLILSSNHYCTTPPPFLTSFVACHHRPPPVIVGHSCHIIRRPPPALVTLSICPCLPLVHCLCLLPPTLVESSTLGIPSFPRRPLSSAARSCYLPLLSACSRL